MNKRKINRSTISGRFVDKQAVIDSPETTVTETVSPVAALLDWARGFVCNPSDVESARREVAEILEKIDD